MDAAYQATLMGIQGIAGAIRHGSFAQVHELAEAAVIVERGGARSLPVGIRAALDSSRSISWNKGTILECSAERWLARHGMPVGRNVSLDLVMHDGAVVRPDILATQAFEGKLLIGEVKHLDHVALRDQIRRYVDIAKANDVPLHLFVPRHTTFSQPLQELVEAGTVRRISLRT